MIQLTFEKSGKNFIIVIDKKKIFYTDVNQSKLWGCPLPFLPQNLDFVHRKIRDSRNKIPREIMPFFDVPPEELAEFEAAKDDEELRKLVLKDCLQGQCHLVEEKRL